MYELVFQGNLVIKTDNAEIAIAKLISFAQLYREERGITGPVEFRFQRVSEHISHLYINSWNDENDFIKITTKNSINEFVSQFSAHFLERPQCESDSEEP